MDHMENSVLNRSSSIDSSLLKARRKEGSYSLMTLFRNQRIGLLQKSRGNNVRVVVDNSSDSPPHSCTDCSSSIAIVRALHERVLLSHSLCGHSNDMSDRRKRSRQESSATSSGPHCRDHDLAECLEFCNLCESDRVMWNAEAAPRLAMYEFNDVALDCEKTLQCQAASGTILLSALLIGLEH